MQYDRLGRKWSFGWLNERISIMDVFRAFIDGMKNVCFHQLCRHKYRSTLFSSLGNFPIGRDEFIGLWLNYLQPIEICFITIIIIIKL